MTLRVVHLSLALSVSLAAAQPVLAQDGVGPGQFETRLQLDSAARAAENQGRSSEAWLLRSRLNKGDFQEGDRVVVILTTMPKPDTMVVRAGRVLRFTGMDDLALNGVLRSELAEAIRRHLSKYLVSPEVRVQPLFAVTVMGNIGNPGFYYTSPDVVLRDVLMRAGGPRDADLNRVIIRRDGQTIWQPADVRVALADGLSLDQLHLRAGDEIFVPARRRGISAQTVLMYLSASTSVYFLLMQAFK